MGNGCSYQTDNIYYRCRKEAALYNAALKSREGAANLLCVSPSSLADYELGNTKIVPVDKVDAMAVLYNAPQIRTCYCANNCPLGQRLDIGTEVMPIEKVTLEFLNRFEDSKLAGMKKRLISVASAGPLNRDTARQLSLVMPDIYAMAKAISNIKLLYTQVTEFKK